MDYLQCLIIESNPTSNLDFQTWPFFKHRSNMQASGYFSDTFAKNLPVDRISSENVLRVKMQGHFRSLFDLQLGIEEAMVADEIKQQCFVQYVRYPPIEFYTPLKNDIGQTLITPGTAEGTTQNAYRNFDKTLKYLCTAQPLCQIKPMLDRRGLDDYERHGSTSGPENTNGDQESKVQLTATAEHKTVMLLACDTQANTRRANEYNPEQNFASGHMKDFMPVFS